MVHTVYADSAEKQDEEIDTYFRSKYEYSILKSDRWESVIEEGIMANECFRKKIPQGAEPQIKSFTLKMLWLE